MVFGLTCVDPLARSVRQRAARSAGVVGPGIRSGAGGDEAHRRGVGCGGALSGRQFRGRQLEGMERHFRDDVREFFRGKPGFAARGLRTDCWKPRGFAHEEREPEQSINFVTCHDGFTLNDLVSYDHKHNEANGENNRDGGNDNMSWNCGVEGPTEIRRSNGCAIDRSRIT